VASAPAIRRKPRFSRKVRRYCVQWSQITFFDTRLLSLCVVCLKEVIRNVQCDMADNAWQNQITALVDAQPATECTLVFRSVPKCQVQCLYAVQVFAASVELRSATISFVMSVPPHGTTWLPLDGFSWYLIRGFFENLLRKFKCKIW